MKKMDISGPCGFWGASPTRFLVMGILLLAAHVGAQRALNVIAAYTAPALQFWLVLAAALVFCLLMLAIYLGLVRLMERRGAVELSLRPGARLVIAGLAFGFAMFCAVYAVFWAQGVVRWQGVNSAVDVGRVLALDAFSFLFAMQLTV